MNATTTAVSRPENRLARWAERRPVFFGLAMLICIILLYVVSQKLLAPLTNTVSPDVLNTVASAIVSVGFAGLTTAMGWWREAGFRAPRSGRDLRVLWLPSILLISLYSGFKVTSVSGVLLLVVAALLTGFLEEIVYRGLILRAFLPGGAVRAAVASSALFALMHLDRVTGGAALSDVLIQVGLSIASGIFLTAITLRTRSIWPAILYHTLHDLVIWLGHGGLRMPVEPSTTWIVIMVGGQVLLFLYGIILLRGLCNTGRAEH